MCIRSWWSKAIYDLLLLDYLEDLAPEGGLSQTEQGDFFTSGVVYIARYAN